MVIACIVAALLTMQIYIKRAIQGKMRESADAIGEQYGARYMDSEITITERGTTTVKAQAIKDPADPTKFGLETIVNTNEATTRRGEENVGAFEKDLFD